MKALSSRYIRCTCSGGPPFGQGDHPHRCVDIHGCARCSRALSLHKNKFDRKPMVKVGPEDIHQGGAPTWKKFRKKVAPRWLISSLSVLWSSPVRSLAFCTAGGSWLHRNIPTSELAFTNRPQNSAAETITGWLFKNSSHPIDWQPWPDSPLVLPDSPPTENSLINTRCEQHDAANGAPARNQAHILEVACPDGYPRAACPNPTNSPANLPHPTPHNGYGLLFVFKLEI